MKNNVSYQVIARHPGFIVINKAPGISVHQEGSQPGLTRQLKHTLNLTQLYTVHRLDKITSGLMVFATDKAHAQIFGELFEQRKIDKYYVALSYGKPKKKQGTIKGDMERTRRGAWKLCHSQSNPAITHFKSYGTDSGIRLFLVKPASGKTHQIRVALKSLGTPILGDNLYGGAQTMLEDKTQPIDRTYLHAVGLSFSIKQQSFQFQCPPECGVYFQIPAIQNLITDRLNPPWKQAIPGS